MGGQAQRASLSQDSAAQQPGSAKTCHTRAQATQQHALVLLELTAACPAAHRKGRLSQIELNSCQGTPLPVSSTATIWNVLGAPCLGLGYCKGAPQRGGAGGLGVRLPSIGAAAAGPAVAARAWDSEMDAGGCSHRAISRHARCEPQLAYMCARGASLLRDGACSSPAIFAAGCQKP